MTTPPSPSDPDEPQAPPIVGGSPLSPEETFLQNARLILAEQRGLNARSRLKLETAARQLGLSDDQVEAVITTIQRDSDDATIHSQTEGRVLEFQAFLDDRIADLRLELLTQIMEEQLIVEGVERFGIDGKSARRVVRECLEQAGLQTVSQQQAEDHVSNLVAELLDDGTALADNLRAQLFEEGRQWGLEPPQVDRVIRRHIRRNRKRDLASRGMTGIALALGVGGIVALIGFFGWLVILNGRRSRDAPNQIGNTGSRRVSPAEQWWATDEQLATSITLARIEMPALNASISKLDSQELDDRGRAYQELIQTIAGQDDNRQHLSTMQALVAGCYSLEPSDYCARKLADELLGLIPGPTAVGQSEVAAIDRAFWSADAIAAALNHPKLTETRRALLIARLGERTQRPAPVSGVADARPLVRTVVCGYLLDRLIAAAEDAPIGTSPLFSAALRHADPVLDKTARESKMVQFLSRALPAAGDDWRRLDAMLSATIQSTDPLVVLEIVNLFESVDNDSLREFLASRLLQRAGIFTPSIAMNDVADVVREALGATDPVADRKRQSELASAIRAALDLPNGVDDTKPSVSLQQAIQLAHASTLACAADMGELGRSSFDELARDEPFQLVGGDSDSPERNRPSTAANSPQLERVLRQLQRLTDADRLASSRPAMLAGVAGYASYVPDLPPDSAAELARYLLAAKSRQEHDLILEYVVQATRWPNVRLALADQVAETSLQRDRCVEMLSRVLQKTIALPANSDWRRELKDELIKDVLNDLSYTVRRESRKVRLFDDTRQSLFDLYTTQARLIGVPLDRLDTESPADVMKQLAESQLRLLADQPPANMPKAVQQRLWLEVETIDYVAESDLDRTIQWQRIWARVLALRITATHPTLSAATSTVIDSLQSDDRTDKPSAVHLRNGERALLRLWALNAGFAEYVSPVSDP